MKRLIVISLLVCLIGSFFTSSVFAFEKTESGIVTVPNLPSFTDEEFLNAPVRIEIFSKDWCKYCQQLENSMIGAIYSVYSKDQVAIRILDAEHPEVEKYFAEYQNMFDNVPEERKGRVPTTIINGKYMKIGYGENMDSNIIKGIGQLLNGEEFSVLNPFVLKEEYKGKTDNRIYQYKKEGNTANNVNNNLEENKNGSGNENKQETTGEKQIKSNAFADNVSFFAVQGLYDSLHNPIFAYMLAILLFFITYNKGKSFTFSTLYILGLIGANIVTRFFNTGLYIYRQPILIVLSLLFAYISLTVFWDIFFTALNKSSKTQIKYNRNFVLNILSKFLNSKISYLFAFAFAFATYFFTTPYDLDYGAILVFDERFNEMLKIVLIIINGICASVLSIFSSIIVQAGKKMSHELIEPLKKYNLLYFGALFYAILTFLLISNIFKMYYMK